MSPRKSNTSVEIVPASNVTPDLPADPRELTFIIASDKVRMSTALKSAHLISEAGVANTKGQRSLEAACAEEVRMRRMCPAIESIASLFPGIEVPDLAGKSDEYKALKAARDEAARDEMINALRKEGLTIKGATVAADQEMERVRKSLTRAVRIAVEGEAKAIKRTQGREAAVRFILASGFGYSGEVTSKDYAGVIESKEWKLDKDGNVILPEGLVFSENGQDVVKAVPQLVASDSTNVPTAETIQAELEAMAKDHAVSVLTVQGNLTTAMTALENATRMLSADVRESSESLMAAHALVVKALKGFETKARKVMPVLRERETWTDAQWAEYGAWQKALEAINPGEAAPAAPEFVNA